MSIIQKFENATNEFNEKYEKINSELSNLKEKIIRAKLSEFLDIKAGKFLLQNQQWIDEVEIDGENFTFIFKKNESYSGYVVYTEKEYYTVGLGFLYKGALLSPQVGTVNEIMTKYSEEELLELIDIMNSKIDKINNDILLITKPFDIKDHPHYYGEYNGGFESNNRFETIEEVINDFKKFVNRNANIV